MDTSNSITNFINNNLNIRFAECHYIFMTSPYWLTIQSLFIKGRLSVAFQMKFYIQESYKMTDNV